MGGRGLSSQNVKKSNTWTMEEVQKTRMLISITLGPAYNEFGYNELPATTSK